MSELRGIDLWVEYELIWSILESITTKLVVEGMLLYEGAHLYPVCEVI